jgi:hypothetical protein
VCRSDYEIKDKHVDNFQKFVLCKAIPEDLSHSLMRRVATLKRLHLFLRNNDSLSDKVVESMKVASMIR